VGGLRKNKAQERLKEDEMSPSTSNREGETKTKCPKLFESKKEKGSVLKGHAAAPVKMKKTDYRKRKGEGPLKTKAKRKVA